MPAPSAVRPVQTFLACAPRLDLGGRLDCIRPQKHTASQAFAKTFGSTPDDLDMALIYDVSHNIAKAREQERARATPFRRVLSCTQATHEASLRCLSLRCP
jgi:hypothetical protein